MRNAEALQASLYRRLAAKYQDSMSEKAERQRMDMARQEASLMDRNKTHPVLGKLVSIVPAKDYFDVHIREKGLMQDRDFRKWLHKKRLKPAGLAVSDF